MKTIRSLASALVTTALIALSVTHIDVLFAQASTPAPKASAATADGAPKELMTLDRKEGEGPAAAANDPVAVHYTGYLWDASAPLNKGTKFDSSIERGVPIGFIIGAGRVIKGWDEGIVGMKVGGQRTLVIPPDKAYGEKGAGALIAPNSTLVFDVELMSIIGKTQNAKANPSPFVPPAASGKANTDAKPKADTK
jgi:FKBP-type peptidyl-prolyl cis-trans isomerase FkpA